MYLYWKDFRGQIDFNLFYLMMISYEFMYKTFLGEFNLKLKQIAGIQLLFRDNGYIKNVKIIISKIKQNELKM